MKQITLILLFLTFFNVFSQVKEGDRAGTLFYPTIDRNEKTYDISVDLYELGNTRYIEAELYNDNEEKLTSKLFKLIFRDKKYYISKQAEGQEEEGAEREVFIYDIGFHVNNPDGELGYMKLKIKILNEDYQTTDFSQKIFYR